MLEAESLVGKSKSIKSIKIFSVFVCGFIGLCTVISCVLTALARREYLASYPPFPP